MRKVFKARRFDVEEVAQKLDNGQEVWRHVVRHPGAVVILPLIDCDRICLIRTYRVAVDRWLLELPAGTLEPPEKVEVTAARELTEETGCVAGRLEFIHAFRMSPGILDEKMHFFVAKDLKWAAPERELGEQIENVILSWSDVDRLLRDGKIEDAKTLVALLWYMRYRTYA
jgi:ADP-ribose pyrophosphatase